MEEEGPFSRAKGVGTNQFDEGGGGREKGAPVGGEFQSLAVSG